MPSHKVPTHLDTPDGLGRFSFRQIGLACAAFKISWEAWNRLPQIGPSIGDLIRMRYEHLGFAPGSLPMLPLAAEAVLLVPFVALALTTDPPPEHGLAVVGRWFRQRDLLSTEAVADIIGNPEVDDETVTSDFGYHAAWELPAQNLRLADPAAVDIAQELWGQFLSGLTAPIQVLTVSRRIDPAQLVSRIERYPRQEASRLASWLRVQVIGRKLIDRRHYLALCAPDEQTFVDSVDEVVDGLPGLGLRSELIRRLKGDELRTVIRRTWSPRPLPKEGVAPAGAWTVTARQVQSDLEWHEMLVLKRWWRLVRDNALAPLADGPYDVDVIQHIEPIQVESIQDGLERRLDGMAATRPNFKRRQAIEDLESFGRSLEAGEEQPFGVTTLFHVHHSDRKEVQKEAKRLVSRVRRSGARATNLRWEQVEALLAASPLGVNHLRRRTKRVDTSSVKRCYPCSASAMWPDGSVPLGETLDSRRPVGWTPWARPMVWSPHLTVFANSGGGKGFGVKVATSRLLFAGETRELYGFDQAEEDLGLGEYGLWARYCGLEYRHVRTMSDLAAALADLDNPRFGPGICWNIAQLPLADRPEMFVRVKEALWKRAALIERRRQWVIDELWSFVQDTARIGGDPAMMALCMAAIEDVARRGRHMKMGGVWMTQRVRDAVDNPVVQVIQSQAASQLYGVQNPAEISSIAPGLQWTPAECAAVRRFTAGQFLLVAGPWRVTLAVTASPEEFAMANTDGKVERHDVPDVDRDALDFDEPAVDSRAAVAHRNGRVPTGALPAQ